MQPHALKLALHQTLERKLICPPPHNNRSQIYVPFLPKKGSIIPQESIEFKPLYRGSKRLPNLKQKMPAMCSHRVPVPGRRRAPGYHNNLSADRSFRGNLYENKDEGRRMCHTCGRKSCGNCCRLTLAPFPTPSPAADVTPRVSVALQGREQGPRVPTHGFSSKLCQESTLLP